MDQIIHRVSISTDLDIPESVLRKFSTSAPTFVLDEDSISDASTDDDYDNDDGFQSSSSINDSTSNDWKNNRERIIALEETSKQQDKALIQLAHTACAQETEHHQYDEAIFTLAKEVVSNENSGKVQKSKIEELDRKIDSIDQRLISVEMMCDRIERNQASSIIINNNNSRSNATAGTAGTAPPTYTKVQDGFLCDACKKVYRSKQYFPKHKCIPVIQHGN